MSETPRFTHIVDVGSDLGDEVTAMCGLTFTVTEVGNGHPPCKGCFDALMDERNACVDIIRDFDSRMTDLSKVLFDKSVKAPPEVAEAIIDAFYRKGPARAEPEEDGDE